MPRMSQLNAGDSKWLKVPDLEQLAGCDWSRLNLELVVESTSVDEYKPGEPAYCLHFHGIGKPLGCNVTNRRMLEQMLGDVDWLEQSIFRGVRLLVYVEQTEKGPGIRIRPAPNTVQQTSADARDRISAAMQSQGVAPRQPAVSHSAQRAEALSGNDAPPGSYHQDDPGPAAAQPFPDDVEGF